MRSSLIISLFLTSCVIYETDTGLPERDCGMQGAAEDDGHCHCRSDCKPSAGGTTCLSEYAYGYPGGVCSHLCTEDAECSPGFICYAKICTPHCKTTSDCVAGRICQAHNRPVPLCVPVCDEDTDCDNKLCNVYSGHCLLDGEDIRGGGLNAPCKEDSECRSKRCEAGICNTSCDMSSPHCPDGGVCVDGWCENACTAPADCAANQSCVSGSTGQFCR